MPRCTNCKKTLSESDFKKFNETLSKTCVQCLDKRKKRHIIHKNSLNQLEDGSSEYQDTDTSSAIDIQTDNVENKREVRIELSQLVSELVSGNNLLELDVIFDNEEEEDSIFQISELNLQYKWKYVILM